MKNPKLNILITAVSRKIQLVKYFKKVLEGKFGPGNIIGIDMDKLSAGIPYCDSYFTAPEIMSPEYVPFLIDLCARENIELIIPTLDEEIPIFVSWKDHFAFNNISVLVSDSNTAKLCNDIYNLSRFLEDNSIPTMKCYLSNELDLDSIQYPVYIMPRNKKHDLKPTRIDDEQDFKYFSRKLENPIVQEYLYGEEYNIDVLASFSGEILAVVPSEVIKVHTSNRNYSITRNNRLLVQAGENVCKTLGLTGPMNIKGKMIGKQFKIMDINPRFSDGIPLTVAAGCNFPEMIVRLIRGERITPMISKFVDGLIMVYHEEPEFIHGLDSNNVAMGQLEDNNLELNINSNDN